MPALIHSIAMPAPFARSVAIAALMGAMSSVFNSASTMVTLDFYKKYRPSATEKQLVNFGRIATGAMVHRSPTWATNA